jgi:hypothetical protein
MKLVGNVATQYMGYVAVGCVKARKLSFIAQKTVFYILKPFRNSMM